MLSVFVYIPFFIIITGPANDEETYNEQDAGDKSEKYIHE